MSDTDRLAELRRQRAMLGEHLAWLDREIAAEAALSGCPVRPEPLPETPAPEPTPLAVDAPVASEADAEAEAVMAEYRVAPSDLQRDVRKGCLFYLIAAFAFTAAVVAVLYLTLRH